MAKVRTRVAPSPTGDPHVGTAYIALFDYCFSRSQGGEFVLRIEDTDRQRSTKESEQAILDSLKWAGLTWDEGPDVGGPYGPYRQSERSAIYAEHAQILLNKGAAFKCFCDDARLSAVRQEQMASKSGYRGYDGHCMGLSADDVAAREAEGQPFVVRLKVPREGTCTFQDRLRGDISVDWIEVDYQILLKSDGMPTYHLANVVDDHLMKITHVLRGEEWISSAPKHLCLYEAFGWEPPELIHLPLLRNPDKSKLSKRKNPTSILYYQRIGILPEALLNYLGQMAWSMPDGREKYDLQTRVDHFDIDRVSLGGPVFDMQKLADLNSQYIRELDADALAARVTEWALNPAYMRPMVELAQERIKLLSDLGGMMAFFFQGLLPVTAEDFVIKKLTQEDVVQILLYGQWQLEALRTWDAEVIEGALSKVASLVDKRQGLSNKPFFVAVTGSQVSTPLYQTMALLGADLTRARIRAAIDVLGGVGKKKEKKMRSAYDRALR